MYIDFHKAFLVSAILIRVINSLSVNFTTTITAELTTTTPVITSIENGQQNLNVTSNSTQITLMDIENSFDLTDSDTQEVRIRGKRCIRDLLTKMLNMFCSKYNLPPTPTSPLDPKVQPIHVHIHDNDKNEKKKSGKKVLVEDNDDDNDDDDDDDDDSSSEDEVEDEDGDDEDSNENDQDFKEVQIEPLETNDPKKSEKRLLKRLKKLERKYDKINKIEERELIEKAGKNHRRIVLKVARNTQYAGVKRKILSFPSPKKRVRLLVQLKKSFKKIISTQEKIHAIHKSASRKSRKSLRKHHTKSH